MAGCSASAEQRAHQADEPVGPEVQIGAGVAANTMAGRVVWTAWLYRTTSGSICMKFRWQGVDGDGGCGDKPRLTLTSDGLVTYVLDAPAFPGAKQARIVFADRGAATYDLVVPEAGVTDGIGYIALSLDGAPRILRIEMLDGTGAIVETQHVDDTPDLHDPRATPTPSRP